MTADPVMQAPFWSQGLNRYSYVFNNPINNTDPSGFIANGADYSGVAATGWGAGVTGIAALSGVGAGAIAGGAGIGGLNVATSLATGSYGMFDAKAGGVYTGTAPSGAPKGTGLNAQGGAGATGEIGNVGVAHRPPSACAVGMCLAQAVPGGMGAPGYEVRTDGTGGGVPVEQSSPILDWLVSRVAPEVNAVINIIVSLEKLRQAYIAQLTAKAAGTGTAVYARAPGVPTSADGFIPPKRWNGRMAKNPNGDGMGYPDEKGRVWIPTGDGPLAHGGPHWDVQIPGGGYSNVYPGGKVR